MSRTPEAQALAEYVINTPELLINILYHLDQRTLLCSAQRVSLTWRELIVTTPAIQRRLFLQPEAAAATTEAADDGPPSGPPGTDRRPRLNPLLQELFRPFFTPRSVPASRAFAEVFRPLASRKPLLATPSPRKRARLLRPSATWRGTLTQQPPVRRLGVWTQRQGSTRPPQLLHQQGVAAAAENGAGGGVGVVVPQSDGSEYRVLEFPGGLRMGELYDICKGSSGDPILNFRPFWSTQTRGLWFDEEDEAEEEGAAAAANKSGIAGAMHWHRRRRVGPMERRLRSFTGRDDLLLEGEAATMQVDAVLRLYKINLAWAATTAARVRHVEWMKQFSFPARDLAHLETATDTEADDVQVSTAA